MDSNNIKIETIMNEIYQEGYTISDIISYCGKYNTRLLDMPDEYSSSCKELYELIIKGNLQEKEKGQKLEELTEIVFDKSIEKLFDVYRNCRTSSNEIDLLIRWTEEARLANLNGAYSFLGEYFLCECKNYSKAASVTYVGKFISLMLATGINLGVMVSWEGVSGRSKWTDAKGLIKKIALKEGRYVLVLDKEDFKLLINKKKNLLSLLFDKYMSLKCDISYEKYIIKHEAEDMLK